MDKEKIFKYAVKNAYLHEGHCNPKALIGKMIALNPEIKKDMKKAMQEIKSVCDKVNAMQFEEIEKTFKEFEGTYELKPKEKKEGLQELDWAEKEKVVTRYAPNPNGPFHLGNARAAILSHEYAKMHNGKFILRFEDTDPRIKKPIENAEQIFKEDLEWLGIKADETYFQSDRIELYYSIIKQLIELNKVYICDCESGEWREKIKKKQACKCRSTDSKTTMNQFEKMLKNEIKEGEAVVRLKTDLEHKDPSVRDFWIARAIDKPNHNRVGSKYYVWPAYNLACGVDDHLLGITLILRGQEHSQNMDKQKFLYKYLGWTYPHAIHFGRVKLEGMVLSTSKIKQGIDDGTYSGWDDPRLGTIKSFRRKGFDPRTLKEVIIDIGAKTNDTTIETKKLYDINRKFIDAESDRSMVLENPKEIKVINAEGMNAELAVHPDFEEKGTRKFKLNKGAQNFFVEKKEWDSVKTGETARLRNAYNIKKVDDCQAEFAGKEHSKERILFWLTDSIEAELILNDNSAKKLLIEKTIGKKKSKTRVQLERMGYAIIDSVKPLVLYFTHP